MTGGSRTRTQRMAGIAVTFRVQEGEQQKFGAVKLDGVDPDKTATLKNLLQSAPGQPFAAIRSSSVSPTVAVSAGHGSGQR